MILEVFPVDIIYNLVNYLDGYQISRLNSTSGQFYNLIKNHSNKIWENLLSKNVLAWTKPYNLPTQVIEDFHFKTRRIYIHKDINSNYLKYSLHYYCCKYIIIDLRKELFNNFKNINTVLFYCPVLLNYILIQVYGDEAPIIDSEKTLKSFRSLQIELSKEVSLKNINIIDACKKIDQNLYVVAKVLSTVLRNNLVMDFYYKNIIKSNCEDTNIKRISRRFIYLSKILTSCINRINN